jgi:hypothetical protein
MHLFKRTFAASRSSVVSLLGCKPALADAASSSVRNILLHRCLLQAIPGTFIEHLNDIALDCLG